MRFHGIQLRAITEEDLEYWIIEHSTFQNNTPTTPMGHDSVNSGCLAICIQETHYNHNGLKMNEINMNKVWLLIKINGWDPIH